MRVPFEVVKKKFSEAGRFEILEELGKGGSGYVYRAFDKELNEEVAIKLLKADACAEDRGGRPLQAGDSVLQGRSSTRTWPGSTTSARSTGNPLHIDGSTSPGHEPQGQAPQGRAILSIDESVLHHAPHRAPEWRRPTRKGSSTGPEAAEHHIRPDGQAIILDFGIAAPPESPDEPAEAGDSREPNYMSRSRPSVPRGRPAIRHLLDGRDIL